jgi:flagellar biosynthesis chaperone FliJ
MAVSRALRRLLLIRELEEEQSRLALESASSDLNRLEHALAATSGQARLGRRLVATSASTGELPDRLAGIEETRTAGRRVAVLVPRIADMQLEVAALRQQFLVKRVERRQAEILIKETEARDAIEAGRRSQQALDDWYRNRLHRAGNEEQRAGTSTPRVTPSGNDSTLEET